MRTECPRREALLRLAALIGAPLAGTAVAASWLPTPPLPDVTLLDQDGRPQRLLADLVGTGTVVVGFFFTGCGTVCPPQTALLRELRQRVDASPQAREVQFLSISVDPLGDSPEQLRRYAQRFALRTGVAQGWSLLTGTPADLSRVLQGFGVTSGAPEQHTALVWMGDARRRRWTRVPGLAMPDAMWRQLQELMA